MKNLKIKTKLILLTVISMILFTSFFVINTISTYQNNLTNHITAIKQEAYQIKKGELVNYSEIAIGIINSYYNKKLTDNYTEAQAKKDAMIAIKNIRYGKNGYFWINNLENKMLMHPIKQNMTIKYL